MCFQITFNHSCNLRIPNIIIIITYTKCDCAPILFKQRMVGMWVNNCNNNNNNNNNKKKNYIIDYKIITITTADFAHGLISTLLLLLRLRAVGDDDDE